MFVRLSLKKGLSFFLFFIIFSSCSYLPKQQSYEARKLSSSQEVVYNYPEIFSKIRETLKPNNENRKSSTKTPPEVSFVDALQKDPALLQASKDNLIQTVKDEALTAEDLTKHLRLIPPQGRWGYEDLKFFANHPYYENQEKRSVSNLVQVWRDFIASAEKQIALNVFDFDLKIIADELIKKSKEGVKVSVGIDKNTIANRPEVQVIYDNLSSNGVSVTKVNPVSLNHQKMATADWDDLDKAKVLFSSGNLTQSCLGPEGDLVSVPSNIRPAISIPNANNVLTMKSWILANLVHHELIKTLSSDFLYRGAQYPTTGSFQVTGPNVDPYTLEAYPEDSLVITFSPGGGFRNVNKNIIGHFIKNSSGPVRMIQFAYSSNEVSKSLYERAQKDYQNKNDFDFQSIGDTPFALQFWSQFLKMSGLELDIDENKKKTYIESAMNSWFTNLSKAQLKSLRSKIRVAPTTYGNRKVRINGTTYNVSAKIHHKVMSTGPFAIVGTSFNFSEGAEKNTEQILIFKNQKLVQFVHGMHKWLSQQSPYSVYESAMNRNKWGAPADEKNSSSSDNQLRD